MRTSEKLGLELYAMYWWNRCIKMDGVYLWKANVKKELLRKQKSQTQKIIEKKNLFQHCGSTVLIHMLWQ